MDDAFLQEYDLLLKIKAINMHIVCGLCAGYFIDATTVSECSHTFCKSCIVKHLQTKKSCPECGQKIHETQPLLNLRSDRVMQDVVYKLVPNLFQNEQQREAEFCRSRGTDFALSKSHLLNIGTPLKYTQKAVVRDICNQPIPDLATVKPASLNLVHCYKFDEKCTVKVIIESQVTNNCIYQPLAKKFIQCSTRARASHIKQVFKQLFQDYGTITLTCCGKELYDTCLLKHIILLYWNSHNRKQIPTVFLKVGGVAGV